MRKAKKTTGISIIEYLKRKDPEGYYVIPAHLHAIRLVRKYPNVDIIQIDAETILLRTRSRKTARILLKQLASRKLLLEPF